MDLSLGLLFVKSKSTSVSNRRYCGSIILAQGIGRWGNFMNHEAHGGPVSRAFLEHLHLPDFIIRNMYIEGQYYHPTFLYESIWDVIGFVILITLRKRLKLGETFFGYLIWYSVGRFFVEAMRTDSLMLTSHIRVATCFCRAYFD